MTRLLTLALARALGVGFAVMAGLTLGAVPAAAHDVLTETEPADGSTVEVAPDTVQLTFSDGVVALGTEVQVVGPAGEPMNDGPAVVVGHLVSQPLVPQRPAGSYTVVWRATSSDGHPTSGELTFTASTAFVPTTGAPPVVETPAAAPSGTPPAVAEPTGEPTGDAPTAQAGPPTTTQEESAGVAPWALAAGAGVVVALTAAAVWWVRRQR